MTTSEIIKEVGKIHFAGNIIPGRWYFYICAGNEKTKNKKPDLIAITILSDILYWHRPDRKGQKKFNGSVYQVPYKYYENKFSFTRNQIKDAIKKLRELNLIQTEKKILVENGVHVSLLYIVPNVQQIKLITEEISAVEIPIKEISLVDQIPSEEISTLRTEEISTSNQTKEIKRETIYLDGGISAVGNKNIKWEAIQTDYKENGGELYELYNQWVLSKKNLAKVDSGRVDEMKRVFKEIRNLTIPNQIIIDLWENRLLECNSTEAVDFNFEELMINFVNSTRLKNAVNQ